MYYCNMKTCKWALRSWSKYHRKLYLRVWQSILNAFFSSPTLTTEEYRIRLLRSHCMRIIIVGLLTKRVWVDGASKGFLCVAFLSRLWCPKLMSKLWALKINFSNWTWYFYMNLGFWEILNCLSWPSTALSNDIQECNYLFLWWNNLNGVRIKASEHLRFKFKHSFGKESHYKAQNGDKVL